MEWEPQKLYHLCLNAQIHNNFILLQVSTFLYTGVQVKHLSVGQLASQLAYLTWCSLPSTPGKCWWETHWWVWGGSKLSLLWWVFWTDQFLYSKMALFPPGPFLLHSMLRNTTVLSTWHKKPVSLVYCLPNNLCEECFSFNPAGTLLMPTVYENWSNYSDW